MRRIALIGAGIIAAAAAILVPAGARGALSDGQSFSASVTGTINVSCQPGQATGTATYTVSVSSGGSGLVGGGANQIRVYRDGSTTAVATINNVPDSKSVTEESFPCPQTDTVDGESTFVFQPYRTSGGGSNQGTAVTVTSDTHRTGSAS